MITILLTEWNFYPSVLIGFGIWTTAYILTTSFFRTRSGWGKAPTLWQQAAFHTGTLIGLIALTSALDELGDNYLFSAHMVQHLLLMFITAPLWLAGTPGWLIELIFPTPIQKFARWITSSGPAYVVFVFVMTAWHVPALYNLALSSDGVHIFEHLTFIGAALIGWWPILAADNSVAPSLSPAPGMLYLFLLAIPMTALSSILTFSSSPLYVFYLHVPHIFGLNVLDDQHLGGLFMWVPAHMVVFLMLMVMFQKWSVEDEQSANMPYLNSHS
jgi:putative membrane protein